MGEGFTAVPSVQEPIETNGTEQAPKRRRGRPPKAEGAPSRPRSRINLHDRIAALLMTINLAAYAIPPLKRDALDPVEIDALASALEEQAKESPRFRKMLENVLATTSGGALLGVCAIIGARRAARHGLIPGGDEIDSKLGDMLSMRNRMPASPSNVEAA